MDEVDLISNQRERKARPEATQAGNKNWGEMTESQMTERQMIGRHMMGDRTTGTQAGRRPSDRWSEKKLKETNDIRPWRQMKDKQQAPGTLAWELLPKLPSNLPGTSRNLPKPGPAACTEAHWSYLRSRPH